MVRDLAGTVQVADEPAVTGSLVLDMATGLVLGAGVAAEAQDALLQALGAALAGRLATLPPGLPDLVLCSNGLRGEVRRAWGELAPSADPPPVRGTAPIAGAEDVFDSLLGHLGGRRQPEDLPEPDDWSMAFGAVRRYREQAPWERWSDTVQLALEVDAAGGPARFVCVVLGAAGVQRGLVVHPGDRMPTDTEAGGIGEPARPPIGTLMLFLDAPSELPDELVAKAVRYGWPADDEVVPAFVAMGSEGPRDPSRRDLHRLTVAATAVVAHDRRGPTLVGAESVTTGEVALPEGGQAVFSLVVSPGHAGRGRGGGVERDGTASPPDGGATIDTLFRAFLSDQRDRLAPRTLRKYETVIELFVDCLDHYGHQYLEPDELAQWEAAVEHDDEAFVHLFGADKIVDNLGEFLGYFMVRKVIAGEELLRAAGTVTKKLAAWLAEHGHLAAADAREAADRGANAARELPRAGRLSRLLFEHAGRSSVDVTGVSDDDYVEDFLAISRVGPGELWFEGGIGPVDVPEAASALAQPGWSVNVVLARHRGRWQVVEVGNVYP